jgi:uncharacterized protein YndB with AHSA1/START domain
MEFEVSDILPAGAEEVYAAWMDSEGHSAMTGSPARVTANVGEDFEAWDGYIHGTNLEIDPPRRILQSWRTSEFEDSDEDSLLEVVFEPSSVGTKVTIRHSKLPEHGMQYQQGWRDSYFTPMKQFFGAMSDSRGT